MWYVLAGALVVLILFLCCICACCRCCCGCCCGVRTQNKVRIQDSKSFIETNKPAGGNSSRDMFPEGTRDHPKKNTQFGAKDVLNEQRTCEEFSEDDQPYPTARNLVSQDTHVNDKNGHASSSQPNFGDYNNVAVGNSQDL